MHLIKFYVTACKVVVFFFFSVSHLSQCHKEPFQKGFTLPHYIFQLHQTEAETEKLWCGITKVQTRAPAEILALDLLFLSNMFLKLLLVCGTMTRKEMMPCVTKIQVSRASRFLVRAERSRCHEAMFNRISKSLLDIFHDSRTVSYFLDDITPHIFTLWFVAMWWTS